MKRTEGDSSEMVTQIALPPAGVLDMVMSFRLGHCPDAIEI